MKVYCADSIIIAEKVGNLTTPVFVYFFFHLLYTFIPALTNGTLLLFSKRIVLIKKMIIKAKTELFLTFCILFIKQYVNFFCLVRI